MCKGFASDPPRPEAFLDSGDAVDGDGGRKICADLAVLEPQRADLGTGGRIEVSLLKSPSDGVVFELFGLYHDPASEGVTPRVTDGILVVIVVGGDAEKAFPSAEHVAVDPAVVVVVAFVETAEVDDLHRGEPFKLHVVGPVLLRPGGVVVCDEISRVTPRLYHRVCAFGAVPALKVGLVGVYHRFGDVRPGASVMDVGIGVADLVSDIVAEGDEA